MRVMFVIDEPDQTNGPNVWLTRHLPALRQLGLKPEVLVVTWQQPRTCRFAAALERTGIPVRRVTIDGYAEASVATLVAALSLDPPDVFVPNCSILAHLAARFLRDGGVTTVAILHSDDRYYRELFEMFVAGRPEWRVSGVVVVSDFLRELVRTRSGWPVPTLHASCGVLAASAQASWLPDRFSAIYAGRLVEYQKRVTRLTGHLIAAADAVPHFSGVLYGDGDERDAVTRMITLAGCDRVRLGGVLSPEEMRVAMPQAQAFVLLSDFEGLSIALVEAMAAGLVPIVSRTRSGVADLIQHEESGFIIDADDRKAFVDICRRLAGDHALWARISRAARAVVIERGHTVEHRAAEWASFVRTLTRDRRPAPPIAVPSEADWDRAGVKTGPGQLIQIHYRPALRNRLLAVAAAGRPIFIWGAGAAGQRFLDEVAHLSLPIRGYLDSDGRKSGSIVRNLPVALPSIIGAVAGHAGQKRPFVVVTSIHAAAIAASLDAQGFLPEHDYSIG